MKKAVVMVLCLLLAGCGSSWEKGCAAAVRLAADWDAAELNCYRYEGFPREEEGKRCFVVELRPSEGAFTDEAQRRQHLGAAQVTRCVESVARDLAACFEGLDVHTVFVVRDENGAVLHTFVDGKLIS